MYIESIINADAEVSFWMLYMYMQWSDSSSP